MKHRRSLLMLAVACSLALVPFSSHNGQAQTSSLLGSYYLTNTNNIAGYPQTNFGTGTQAVYAVATVTQQEVAAQYRLESDVFDALGNPVSLNRIPTNLAGAVVVPMQYQATQGTNAAFPDGGYCAVAATVIATGYSIISSVPFSVGPTAAPDCNAIASVITFRLATVEAAPTATRTPTATVPVTATLIPTLIPTSTPIPSPTPIPTATASPTLVPTAVPTDTPTAIPTPTTPPLKHFVLTLSSTLQAGRFGNLAIGVHGTSGHPLSGVRVTMDGRGVGMNKLRVGRTDNNGNVTFANLWPPRSGTVRITGVKSGWWSQQVGLVIR